MSRFFTLRPVHTNAFSTIHTKTFENDRIALRYFRSLFWFWCDFDLYPSKIIRYVCAFVLIHFQERFQIDAFSMKTLSVLVWKELRTKRIEMYAFWNEDALVWTDPNFYHIICYLFSKLIHSHTIYCGEIA